MTMRIRGTNYDVGTRYDGRITRTSWRPDQVSHDMRAIRDQLHCNSVSVYGSDFDRLAEAATIALDAGLDVWLQPRSIEADFEATLRDVATAAQIAASFDVADSRVRLNVGCEWSIFAAGIMPGRDYAQRADRLRTMWWLLPLFNRRLNRLLGRAAATARQHFSGPITYSAALWEGVDWRPFDVVGTNYYRLNYNARNYPGKVARFLRHGKPVVITEFGCCAFDGADKLGPAGHGIVDWSGPEPAIPGEYVRDEAVQARYLGELLAVYRQVGAAGAFVFDFSAPGHPHDAVDPRRDIDMAGYGLVKSADDGLDWQPKAAFAEVARIYGELAADGQPTPDRQAG